MNWFRWTKARFKRKTCPVPDCPIDEEPERDPSYDDPRCICNKPLWLVILPGQHIHCPVHPEHVIRGGPVYHL